MRRLPLILPALIVGLIAGAIIVGALRIGGWWSGSDPESVASATLQSVREQARLVPFTARFVTVVTSTQRRLGLRAQRTLIMPGTVRYELDLARIQERDMSWDRASNTLSVTLPPLELAGPEIDLSDIREYGQGRILMALTNVEDVLDAANRQRATQELLQQARAPLPMRLARESAKRAVARSFALPLRAAGIEANVAVRFADEPSGQEPSYMDRSRRMEEVLKERREAREQ